MKSGPEFEKKKHHEDSGEINGHRVQLSKVKCSSILQSLM